MRFESFSRSLLGWSCLSGYEEVKGVIFAMIKNGISKEHKDYWGGIVNNDQKIVELFPILLFCITNKEQFNSCFSAKEKQDFQNWFLKVNRVIVPKNNWQFFVVLVNTFLKCLSLEYSEVSISRAIKNVDSMYLGNGWYSDGITFQRDYYIPFAFHFYSLLFAKYYPDHEYSKVFIERSREFSKDFVCFFAENGSALAFGRSLTYKFAQSAFWSIYSDFVTDKNELSVIKGIINRNLNWWLKQDIFDHNGFLNVGYSYPNQFMTEYYNAKGSSYWCLKTFVFLLNGKDDFFQIDAAEYKLGETSKYKQALLSNLITHNGNSYLFMNGQNCKNEFGNVEAKYEKFLYTTLCAPCISRSSSGLENLASDNSLVLKIGNTLLPRKKCVIIHNDDKVQISDWRVSSSILIRSYIYPSVPYHYRVHIIKSDKPLILFDFGSAIPHDENLNMSTDNNIACCISQNQVSMVYPVDEHGFVKICKCSPNVNLQYPNVVIPYVASRIPKGMHYIIDCFYNDITTTDRRPPQIKITPKKILYNEQEFILDDLLSLKPNVSYKSKLITMFKDIKLILKYMR